MATGDMAYMDSEVIVLQRALPIFFKGSNNFVSLWSGFFDSVMICALAQLESAGPRRVRS